MDAVAINRSRRQARALARGLGVFSLMLGAVELLKPRAVKRSVGTTAPRGLVRAYGMREIASGAAILAAKNPNQWVWSRVAGDVVDLATLVPTLRRTNPHRRAAQAAIALVGALTVLDIYCAMKDGSPHREAERDYSDRSGFPKGLEYAKAA